MWCSGGVLVSGDSWEGDGCGERTCGCGSGRWVVGSSRLECRSGELVVL